MNEIKDPIRRNVIRLMENVNPFIRERWQFTEKDRRLIENTAEMIRKEQGPVKANPEEAVKIRFYVGIRTPEEMFTDLMNKVVETETQEGIDEAIRYYMPLISEKIMLQKIMREMA